jgi:transposase
MGTEVVCGLDVHRSVLVGCIRRKGAEPELASFKTNARELRRLDDWLTARGCTTVGMEATGVYWKPVHHALEAGRRVIVANPQHIKALKGRKTDRADAAWIARKLEDEDGIRPSFVPEPKVRETRDLVRFRENLVKSRTQIRNEVQKLLAGAGVPVAEVISDLFGVSGQAILAQLVQGETAWDRLEGTVKGKLKQKVEQLRLALEMPLTEIQRWELAAQLKRHEQAEADLQKVDDELARRLASMEAVQHRLMTIPGIAKEGATLLLGFFGSDLSAFPTDGHFASWIGLSPGDNESAGKRRYAGRRKGNRFLQGKFTQFAWAAVRTNGCWLQHKYRSLCGRMPKQKAIGAIAHKLAVIVYHIIQDGAEYRDHGEAYVPSIRKARELRRAIATIERHGGKVQFDPMNGLHENRTDADGGFTG